MYDAQTCQERTRECEQKALNAKDAKQRKAYLSSAAWWAKRAAQILAQSKRRLHAEDM
jgi:hypothetical protein